MLLHIYQHSDKTSSWTEQLLFIDNIHVMRTSTNGIWGNNSFVYPIGSSRTITMERTQHKTLEFELIATGYRRIGSNS